MTVQQERATTVAPSTVRVPAQRTADHDAPTAAPAARQLRGWGSEHDRSMARAIMLMMTALSAYIAVMLVIAIRVWD